jgi:hypothetical protein
VPVQSFEEHGVGARQLVSLIEALLPPFEGLLTEHGPAVALHRGVMGGEDLGRKHAFEFVLRTDTNQRRHRRAVLYLACCRIGVRHPESLHGLIGKQVVPMI